MSVFRVNLSGGLQGDLDTSISGSYSLQRSIFLPGPRGVFRKLDDGETFTDTNYYKRYSYPTVSRELALLEILTDDGTTWSDTNSDNNTTIRVANFTVAAGETYTDEVLDILSTYGGPSVFTHIVVSGDEVNVKLNGSSDAIMSLATGTHIFDRGDLVINSIAFDNSESGASTATIQVLMSIEVTSST